MWPFRGVLVPPEWLHFPQRQLGPQWLPKAVAEAMALAHQRAVSIIEGLEHRAGLAVSVFWTRGGHACVGRQTNRASEDALSAPFKW